MFIYITGSTKNKTYIPGTNYSPYPIIYIVYLLDVFLCFTRTHCCIVLRMYVLYEYVYILV